jgi:lipoprotein-anchoring transpeptidase ErfK/SrfK
VRAPAAAVVGLALVGCGEKAEPPPPRDDAFEVVAGKGASNGGIEGKSGRRGRFVTAAVTRRAALRATRGGRVVARVGPKTEFGSRRVLAVTRRRDGWLRVIATERPNGRAAWLRASAARLGSTDVWIRVDRSRRQLTLRRGDRVLRRVPVAVGRAGTPTPLGRFAVTDRLRSQRSDSPYGCCAIALSGHQTKLLPGWPGGDRLAIHATPNPETIGHAVSLGCMRAPTAQMHWMMRHVPLGAPVFVAL